MNENANTLNHKRNLWLVAGSTALLAILGTLGMLSWAGWLKPPVTSQQAMVHNMGAQVMPFDLSQTTHIFEMTESGGVQQVIAKDPGDTAQIALIQQHIQHEATLFSAGDFSDPSSLHGDTMPGVKELSAAAAQSLPDIGIMGNSARLLKQK